ncbi:uncharacterized protein LOC135956584 [Calliphora vicina]|uniref:uncharacterized protein LOC135956584 n=1 Tax=Calliphora vicina TaxID=7373 RepID=UPI00325A7035
MGPQTVLSDSEEKRLVKWCQDLAKCGFPLKSEDLLNTVQTIVKEEQRTTPFLNGRPGRKWYQGFLKRHPCLSIREAEGISKGRAVVTEEAIRKWFNGLKKFLNDQNALDILADPSRIFNGDETSFSMCPKTGKVLAPKGYRNVYSIQKGNEKETITVLLVFSANGKTVVPMVVFPYIRPPKDIINSLPENWFLGKSESGWMVSEVEYIANGVHNWLNDHNVQRPILLFVDGHKSHMTLELSQFCEDNNIILYALPPNTTHMLQPADVSVFKPLKQEWKNTIREWQLNPENICKVINKSTFCPLLHAVLSKINMEDTIKNGFRKCGLYPFNPDNVDYTKCVKNQLELLVGDQSENEKRLKERDFDRAIEIINRIAPNLCERGIDSDVIIEEINNLKRNGNDQPINILSNVTIESGTYIINEEGVLEKQTELVVTPTLDTDNPSKKFKPVHYSSPTASTINDNDTSFQPLNCSSPIPTTPLNINQPLPTNRDCSSPSSSVTSTIGKNSLGASLMKAKSMSPTFEKHLYFPKPSTSSKRILKPKAPSAISALAWRVHIESKEREKIDKAEAIKERKLQRQQRKINKENKPKKNKKGKIKQVCGTCKEDLDTDAEDDGLKNIGCDICPQWFHLKCTNLKELPYDDVMGIDFVCIACNDQID